MSLWQCLPLYLESHILLCLKRTKQLTFDWFGRLFCVTNIICERFAQFTINQLSWSACLNECKSSQHAGCSRYRTVLREGIRGSGVIAPHIHTVSSRWSWMFTFTLLPVYPGERRHCVHRVGGWMGDSGGQDVLGKRQNFCSYQNRTPDLSAPRINNVYLFIIIVIADLS